ncbi:hypothetical protein MAP00_001530 [Monascus purpureus]|nr:hypothetical protein MAP00_001530 [Monascus purpureus]
MWARAIRGRVVRVPPALPFTIRDRVLAGGCTFAVGERVYLTSNSAARPAGNETALNSTPDLGQDEPTPDLQTVKAKTGEDSATNSPSSQGNKVPDSDSRSRDAGPPSLLEVAKAGTSSKIYLDVSRKVIDIELKWMKNRRDISDRVAKMLRSGQIALAAELVRTAQKRGMECTVAWNHLMTFSMEKGEPLAAFKFYNDMKKRGRKPNDRTYTIMLKGLASAPRDPALHPVRAAYAIYRSSFASNTHPNIYHSNSMLDVCRRHGDMDMLWQVAGELPEEGPDAPDRRSYTVILHSIREASQRDVAKMQKQEVDKILERKSQSVLEAKRVWTDIVFRWKKGQLSIDNVLVGAMAEALLDSSSERDCYNVFALYHQTHGIPVLADKPADFANNPKATLKKSRKRGAGEVEDVPFVDEHDLLVAKETGMTKEPEQETFEGLFDPVVPAKMAANRRKNEQPTPSYLEPGNKELTLILEACRTMTQAVGTGKAYWERLTHEDHEYNIEPDIHSFHQYLRLLRVSRSSRMAVDLIRDEMIPTEQLQRKTFHIALSCCRRDRKNINVFKHANELLDLMNSHLPLPETRALLTYLEIVDILADSPNSLLAFDTGDEYHSTKLDVLGRKLQSSLRTTAVSHLRPHVAKLEAAIVQEPSKVSSSRNVQAKKTFMDAVPGYLALKVLVRTRALIDTILKPENESFLSEADCQLLQKESQRLKKYSDQSFASKFKSSYVVAPALQSKNAD